MYFNSAKTDQSPYEMGEDLFGKRGSGHADASTTYKTKLKKKLNEKHSH